jgi:hypothetical protein
MHLGKGLDFVADEFDAFTRTRDEEDVLLDGEAVLRIYLVDELGNENVLCFGRWSVKDDVWYFLVPVEIVQFANDAVF